MAESTTGARIHNPGWPCVTRHWAHDIQALLPDCESGLQALDSLYTLDPTQLFLGFGQNRHPVQCALWRRCDRPFMRTQVCCD